MWVAIYLVVGAIWLLYRLLTEVYGYWKAKGIPHVRGRFPHGSMSELLSYRRYLGYVHQKIYRLLAPHPYGGIFVGRQPVLVLRDPALIGQVLVKDFSHFRDRDQTSQGSADILAKNLFRITGDDWRALRSKMTPTFTSGKLKNMYVHFENCARELDLVLNEKAGLDSVLDIKDTMSNFTLDIICTCAFGLDVQSTRNPDNELKKAVKDMFSPMFPVAKHMTVIYGTLFPKLRKIFKTRMYPSEITDVFSRIVRETVEYRERNGVSRNDFLDMMIELKNNASGDIRSSENSDETTLQLNMTLDLLVAQCFVFFIAGYESSSSVMSYSLYEMALNSDIQEKVRSEIDHITSKHGGLTYDAINEMEYLDQVVSETIRKYPTLQYLNRTCTKEYRMDDSGAVIDKDTLLLIPVYALHHDPAYFPDPELFDPDRFSPERKSSIVPYSYLPFGEGPRNCVGLRFGKMQAKLGICTVLSKYKLVPTSETHIPLEFVPTHMITTTKGPIYLKIERRN